MTARCSYGVIILGTGMTTREDGDKKDKKLFATSNEKGSG